MIMSSDPVLIDEEVVEKSLDTSLERSLLKSKQFRLKESFVLAQPRRSLLMQCISLV